MKKVTGIGGIFFRSKDPEKTRAWYEKHLGIIMDDYGSSFEWKTKGKHPGYTAWSVFTEESDYFPQQQSFLVNYRVADLEGLLVELKHAGVQVIKEIESYEYGKFAHIVDCDGVQIELWEPDDKTYGAMLNAVTRED